MTMRLIEGEVEPDDGEITALHEEIRQLREDLAASRRETAQAKHEASRAVSALRKQLTPLYRALQGVFGELDTVGGEDLAPATTSAEPRVAAIWASWKTRLGGQCGKVIDALLLQSDMNTTQLAIAIGTHRQNIPGLIYKLNQAGLLTKNGGRFSLKQL
jgi:chromosome segregation ATPase